MLSSGFTNAPVTKLALVYIIAASILVSIADAKYLFYIQVNPHIWQYHQLWRFLIWPVRYYYTLDFRIILKRCWSN